MDQPADPATPFGEVYQSFLDDLAVEGIKTTTIERFRRNIVRFERWVVETGRPVTLAPLERTVLFASRQHLEDLPQGRAGRSDGVVGGLMSRHTVHPGGRRGERDRSEDH